MKIFQILILVISLIALILSIYIIIKISRGISIVDISEFENLPLSVKTKYREQVLPLAKDLSKNIKDDDLIDGILATPVCLLSQISSDKFKNKYKDNINKACPLQWCRFNNNPNGPYDSNNCLLPTPSKYWGSNQCFKSPISCLL